MRLTAVIVTLVNMAAGIKPAAVHKLETALVTQSRQLSDWWHTPTVTFGNGGWELYLLPGNGGLHYAPDSNYPGDYCSMQPNPCMEAGTNGRYWTTNVSHELMEALADPTNTGNEVADPVENSCYLVHGDWLQDFVTPYWFTGSGSTYDQMRELHKAGETDINLNDRC